MKIQQKLSSTRKFISYFTKFQATSNPMGFKAIFISNVAKSCLRMNFSSNACVRYLKSKRKIEEFIISTKKNINLEIDLKILNKKKGKSRITKAIDNSKISYVP